MKRYIDIPPIMTRRSPKRRISFAKNRIWNSAIATLCNARINPILEGGNASPPIAIGMAKNSGRSDRREMSKNARAI
jgi:sugar (pentulose or hexulose) kinase